jgi:hypothetical protein
VEANVETSRMDFRHGNIVCQKYCDKETIRVTVEDAEGWKKLEQGIERSMREKDGDVVILTIQYKKKFRHNSGSSEDEGPPLKKVFLI